MNNITNIGQYIQSVQQSIALLTSKVLDLEKLLIKEIANGQGKSSADASGIISVVEDMKKQLNEIMSSHANKNANVDKFFSDVSAKIMELDNKCCSLGNTTDNLRAGVEGRLNSLSENNIKLTQKIEDIEKELDSRIVKSVDAIFSAVPVPKVDGIVTSTSVVDDIFANVSQAEPVSTDIEIVPKKTPGRKKVTPKTITA